MRPSVEAVRARLERRLGFSRPAVHPSLAAWLRVVFAGQQGWLVVWGARHTTRLLAQAGAIRVESQDLGYERIRLTRLGREAVS